MPHYRIDNQKQTRDKGPRMRFYHRIAFKACSIIILVELAAFVIIGLYYVKNFSDELVKHAEAEIQNPGILINQGALAYSAIEEKATLARLVESEDVTGMIMGLNKRVFHATNKDYLGRTIDEIPAIDLKDGFFDFSIKTPKIIHEINERGRFLYCLSPLFAVDGESPRFFLYLKLNTTWIQDRKSRLVGLYTLSSSVLILFVLNGFVFSKLERLTRAYDTIKRGIFKSDLPKSMLNSQDEIGVLARGFQIMTQNLSETTTSIDNLNKEIHQRQQAETNLKKAKEAAEAATRAKSEFLANMSHEIRTPLNGVMGMTDLLIGTELTEEQLDFAQTIKDSGRSLLAVINDILDYSKIEAGKLDFEITDFDLRATVEDVCGTLAVAAHTKGLELIPSLSPEVPVFVQGDPVRFRQILTNLANNAIKFTQEGEVVIRITLQSESATNSIIRVSVTDTGIGIPQDRIGCLFQSFSQVDASTTRNFGGTGLGLAIAKNLCELMGGEIGVNSQLGKGSEFWFTAVLKKSSLHPAQDTVPSPSVQGRRVLVVDDNATNRKVIRKQLTFWGFMCDEAYSGSRALEMMQAAAARKQPYEIAIVDMQMPIMDGAMLGEKIKNDPSLKHTYLLMLTSLGRPGDASRMKEIGFSICLTKPVKQVHLLASLNSAAGEVEEKSMTGRAAGKENDAGDEAHDNVRILVAEDHKINQKVIFHILSGNGYRVDIVSSGREAIEALAKTDYHIVLMDIQMPEMDGLQATTRIRDRQSRVMNPQVPIIALTAHAMKGDREKFERAGMNDYISKPVDPKDLIEKIKMWTVVNPSHQAMAINT